MAYGPRFPKGEVKADQWYTLTIDFCAETDEEFAGDFDALNRIEVSKSLGQYIAYKLAQSVGEPADEFIKNFVVKNLTVTEMDFISDYDIERLLNPEG